MVIRYIVILLYFVKCNFCDKSLPDYRYTVSQIEQSHFYFYDNFGKCGPISTTLFHLVINVEEAEASAATSPPICCRTTL